MKSFKELRKLTTEAFNDPADWEWGRVTIGSVVAEFYIDDDLYKVSFEAADEDEEEWIVDYTLGTNANITTNKHVAMKVLATVMDVIREFIKNNRSLEVLQFNAKKEGIDRSSTYERLINRYLPSGWDYTKKEKGRDNEMVEFRIEKK